MSKVGIYPGTFDPITYGHIDVIKRSLKVVDKLIIGVSNDYSKNCLFSAEERTLIIKNALFKDLNFKTHIIKAFTFNTLTEKHVKGYLLWAVPTVKYMKKYPKYRKLWRHIAQHRANDIAWRLNEGKFDLLGRIYAGIGEPLCWLIGNFVGNKRINELNITNWRKA